MSVVRMRTVWLANIKVEFIFSFLIVFWELAHV